ncbi:MAG: hypothetical protein AAF560_14450 [Acidobacteriota bacterium]
MKKQLPQDFKDFLKLLNANDVEYLLIGGYAVGYHGYPRSTYDMDIWIGMSPQNADKMVQVMEEFGFPAEEISPEMFLAENCLIRLGVPPVRLEILTSISGVDFEECYRERVVGSVDGVEVSIISLQDLRRNKQASGRYKDLNDLQRLPG